MQFQNNFDIEDFLAYLLPGSLAIIFITILKIPQIGPLYREITQQTSPFFSALVGSLLFLISSLIFGYISSLMSRYIWRNLYDVTLGDSKKAIFYKKNSMFPPAVSELIAKKFAGIFGVEIDDRRIKSAVPRLIRAVVLNQNEKIHVVRAQLVRSRALCGNLITPILTIAVWYTINISMTLEHISEASLLFSAALLMMAKQRYFDFRDARDLYLAFLALSENDAKLTLLCEPKK